MKKFIQSWIISALAVLVAVYVVKGIHYTKPLDLAVAALLLGILNAVLRPFLTLLTLPLLIFTFGLFRLVINALLLYLVGYLLQPDFRVDDFWSAFWGALIISLITVLLSALTGVGGSRVHVVRRGRPKDADRDGGGPVIDV